MTIKIQHHFYYPDSSTNYSDYSILLHPKKQENYLLIKQIKTKYTTYFAVFLCENSVNAYKTILTNLSGMDITFLIVCPSSHFWTPGMARAVFSSSSFAVPAAAVNFSRILPFT